MQYSIGAKIYFVKYLYLHFPRRYNKKGENFFSPFRFLLIVLLPARMH